MLFEVCFVKIKADETIKRISDYRHYADDEKQNVVRREKQHIKKKTVPDYYSKENS